MNELNVSDGCQRVLEEVLKMLELWSGRLGLAGVTCWSVSKSKVPINTAAI